MLLHLVVEDLKVLLIYTLFVTFFLSQGLAHPIVGHLVNDSGVPVNGNSVFAPRRVIVDVLLEGLTILSGDLIFFLSVGI